MAATYCWRCLPRASSTAPSPTARLGTNPRIVPIASFSTTPAALRGSMMPKKKNTGPKMKVSHGKLKGSSNHTGRKGHIISGKVSSQTVKKKIDFGKDIAPGERKAWRKRVQISNNNALPVEGLEELTADSMAEAGSVGRVFSVPNAVIDQLRAVEAFKPTQSWKMFRQPSVLIRPETLQLVQKLRNVEEKKDMLKMVITGERLAGKSVLLLQALADSFMRNWVVINIPEVRDLTYAITEYSPIHVEGQQLFTQPVYLLKLLQAIRKANSKSMSELRMNKTHGGLPVNVPVGTPLLALLGIAREADHAWPVFRALMAELLDPEASRPPILLAMDGLHDAMGNSQYRTPSFDVVHAHDLTLIRTFVDVLSGKTKLPHGGAILAATSRSSAPSSPSTDLAIAQRLAQQSGAEAPLRDPYNRKYDARADDVLKSVQVMQAGPLDKPISRSLMEYWAASGMLRTKVDEKNVTAAWSLGGHGLIGEMERASLLSTLELR